MSVDRSTTFLAAALVLAVAAPPSLAQTNATQKWLTPLNGTGQVIFGKPVVADLDGDGKQEVIVGTAGNAGTSKQGYLWVINHDGTVRWSRAVPSEIASAPAVGKLLAGSTMQIVVGCGASDNTNPGGVFAFKNDGTPLWSFSPVVNGGTNHVLGSVALGDLDGDGLDDVAFGSFNEYAYALKGTNGTVLPGWPVFVRDSIASSTAMADLAGDGNLEVIMGADSHFEGNPIDTPNGGGIYVFRKNGTNFPGFPQFITYPSGVTPVGIQSSPAVGDIDGDGCPEIVVGTGVSSSTGGKLLWAWHSDGSVVNGWPVALDGHPNTSPILVDLDGDGDLDVVASDDAPYLYGFRGDGTQIFKMRPKSSQGGSAVVIAELAAAQVGSNNPTILVGGVGFDVVLVSKNGTQISDDGSHGAGMLTYPTEGTASSPAAGDLDGSGRLDIIAAGGTNDGNAFVVAWDAGPIGALPWPMFRRDPKHSAWVPPSPPHACPRVPPPEKFFTVTPCRVADSRQSGNSTFGGPSYMAGEERVITIPAGGCNVPPTAKSVSLNVTMTNATNGGFLSVFPGGDGYPGTSNINFSGGQTRANNVVVPLSFDGRGHLSVMTALVPGAQVDVIVDVNGYFQ
jgi:hypothetical protein